MITLMKYLFLPLILSGFAFSQEIKLDNPERQGMSSEHLSKAFDEIHAAVDSNQVGCAVGLIARNGGIVFLQSAGEIRKKRTNANECNNTTPLHNKNHNSRCCDDPIWAGTN